MPESSLKWIATVDDVLLSTRRMTHRWSTILGGARTAVVNGHPRRIPLVCRMCLVRDDAPESDQRCRPMPGLAAEPAWGEG